MTINLSIDKIKLVVSYALGVRSGGDAKFKTVPPCEVNWLAVDSSLSNP